ncbi:triggering receptor expressed on myeloid cells 1 [Meriones unguiculatus]|uniref:triggering receptor expressed on myeloid cells 1 n=1 Tax=Meriones unguiculatus TaxID=10047 RepID=UPI000B4FBB4D|nr:triggering receptor expressed on myeloid cells 1 [Meriones unguiculatus]
MRKPGLWGLLWIFFVSETQAAIDLPEERYDLVEGQTLTVRCPFNMKYASSRRAWQRLQAGKEPLNLVVTEKSSTPREFRVGKYILKDDPGESMLIVEMTDLQVTDSGLYRCVIYHPSQEPVLLFYPVRLVVAKASSDASTPDITPTSRPTKVSILTTTKGLPKDPTVTRSLPKSTAAVTSPNPGVTFTNVPRVNRASITSIVVLVVCGLFSKTLIFTVLFAVTQRSYG